jgi:hypothetical protein
MNWSPSLGLEPVFVIGANRSGTSIVASLLNQHPDLEGLFFGPLAPRLDASGHIQSYCESLHLWPQLAVSQRRRQRFQDLPFWGLPQYLSQGYRRRVRHRWERGRLLTAVERHRKTQRNPLINDHFNMLHVGLIADLFPRARFVLTSRSWQGFLKAGIHKWSWDGDQRQWFKTRLASTDPRGGMHWHLLNLIARYDLEVFAPGRYAELWLEELQIDLGRAREALQRVGAGLGLTPFKFDLSLLSPHLGKWTSDPEAQAQRDRPFEAVKTIVGHERGLLSKALDRKPLPVETAR